MAMAADSIVLKGDPNKTPYMLQDVGVAEHLGQSLNLSDLQFTNSADGKLHPLKDFFNNGKPTLLNLVYFKCPMLCTMVLNGVLEGLKGLDWSVGKQFNVITISIDPGEDAELAQDKRKVYVEKYADNANATTSDSVKRASGHVRDQDLTYSGWQFFTGDAKQIQSIADQLGFMFKYDDVQKDYAHPAVTFVLTPEGKISRYLYGVQPRPRDFRLALLEASQGKIGNVFDRLLMFCYHYEPNSRGYALQAVRVMQAGGAGTVFLLGGFLTIFWRRQRKGKRT